MDHLETKGISFLTEAHKWTETKWTPNQHLLKAMNRRDHYVSLTHSDDEEDFSKGTAVEKKIKWSAREEPKDFQDEAENWTLECNLLITQRQSKDHDRELQSRCCQRNLTQVTLQFLWTSKPLLRNLS
jgi:hypothetical protein